MVDTPDTACVTPAGSISCGTVRTIIEPYFAAVQEVFVRFEEKHWGDSLCKSTKLRCSDEAHDAPRHFAGCYDDASMIVVAPLAVDLPEETLLGILAHEFGHALDFARPAELTLDADMEDVRVRRLPSSLKKARVLSNRYRQWEARNDDTVERAADAIARLVTGQHIGYTGACMLQTLRSGPERPEGLR